MRSGRWDGVVERGGKAGGGKDDEGGEGGRILGVVKSDPALELKH